MGNATERIPVTSVITDRSIDKASININKINDMITYVSHNEQPGMVENDFTALETEVNNSEFTEHYEPDMMKTK